MSRDPQNMDANTQREAARIFARFSRMKTHNLIAAGEKLLAARSPNESD